MFLNMLLRSFFAYFDENKCRWEAEQDPCEDSDTGEDSSGDGTDVTDTIDANTTDTETNSTTKPVHQNQLCEPLDETWMCSSGSKNHSLCIKFCSAGLDFSTSIISC